MRSIAPLLVIIVILHYIIMGTITLTNNIIIYHCINIFFGFCSSKSLSFFFLSNNNIFPAVVGSYNHTYV